MPLLNTADAIFVGANAADRIYLGAELVWPSGPPPTFIIGDNGSGGGGNWPTAEDRALFAPFVVDSTATLVSFNMRTRPASGAGARYKGVVYAADGAGAPIAGFARPGTRLAVTAASSAIPAGAQLITLPISGVITPQTIWIGYVCDGEGSGETDSGGTNPARTIMFNQYLSFASPPATAPAWTGSPGAYSNQPAAWLECT